MGSQENSSQNHSGETDSPNRIAATRKSRTRNWPARSDPHQRYPSLSLYKAQIGNNFIKIDTGTDSGRNMLAIFEDVDEEPRLAFNVRCKNGRSKTLWPRFKSVKEADLPVGTTLKQVCRYFPLHVWGDGMRIFMAEGWTAEQIWREIPAEAKNAGAASRPWNYLQQAMGREADKMHEEGGHGKRVPAKRKKTEDKDDDTNDPDDSSLGKVSNPCDAGMAALDNPPSSVTDYYLSPGSDVTSLSVSKRNAPRHNRSLYSASSPTQYDYLDDMISPPQYDNGSLASEHGSPHKRLRFDRYYPDPYRSISSPLVMQAQFQHIGSSLPLARETHFQLSDVSTPSVSRGKMKDWLYPDVHQLSPQGDAYEWQAKLGGAESQFDVGSSPSSQFARLPSSHVSVSMHQDPFYDRLQSSGIDNHTDSKATSMNTNAAALEVRSNQSGLLKYETEADEILLGPYDQVKMDGDGKDIEYISVRRQHLESTPKRTGSCNEIVNTTISPMNGAACLLHTQEHLNSSRWRNRDAGRCTTHSSSAPQVEDSSATFNTSDMAYDANQFTLPIHSPIVQDSFSEMLFDGADLAWLKRDEDSRYVENALFAECGWNSPKTGERIDSVPLATPTPVKKWSSFLDSDYESNPSSSEI